MVLAEELDRNKFYKFNSNGFKLGKYVEVRIHPIEVNPELDPPPPPRNQSTYVFSINNTNEYFGLVPEQALGNVVIDEEPGAIGGRRGRNHRTRRKRKQLRQLRHLKRFRKSHTKNNKNNKK